MEDSSSNLDRFTQRAKTVMELAEDEARRFHHNYIGTEHLLLGLVREGEGVAAKVLSNLGLELTKVRSSVEFIIGRGERQVMGAIGLTPRAKKVIELARDEARRLGHHYIGTEHLLLGLLREGEGIASGVLESLGISLEKVRMEVIKVLTQTESTRPPSKPARASEPEPQPTSPMEWSYMTMETEYRDNGVFVNSVNGGGTPPGELHQSPIHAALNLVGRLGWELVGIHPSSVGGAIYILKRQRRPADHH